MEDLTKKTKNELLEALSKERESLRQARFSLAGGKEKNVRKIRGLKKEIARLLTKIGRFA